MEWPILKIMRVAQRILLYGRPKEFYYMEWPNEVLNVPVGQLLGKILGDLLGQLQGQLPGHLLE